MHLNIESVLSSVSFPAINLFSAYSVEIATAQKKNFACGNKLEESDKKGTLRPRSFLQHTISLKFCRSNTRALTYFIPLYFTQTRRRTNELTLLKSWKYTPILFTPKPRNKLPHYEEIS